MITIRSLIFNYVSSFKKQLLLTFFISLLSSLATILVPLSIGKYYTLVFNFKGGKSLLWSFLPEEYIESVPRFLLVFVALLAIKFVLGFLQRYLISSVGERIVNQMRMDLFEHQLSLDMRVYDEKGIGKYLLRYSGDLRSIQNYITKGLIGFVVDLGLLCVAIISIGLINKSLAIICLISSPIIALPIYLLNKKLNTVSEQRRNKRSNMLSFVNQRLIGILSVKAFNRHRPEFQRFAKRSSQLLSEGLKYHQLSSLIYVLIPVLLYVTLVCIMYFIYQLKQSGVAMQQGGILAAFILILTMLPVCRRLLKVTVVWKLGRISLGKLIAVLNLPNNYALEKDDLVLEQPRIALNQLSLSYGDKEVWKNLNHSWEGNGIHLINGNMGSGKSSLIKLLLGIYYPSSGEIIIDKQTTYEVNEKSLRKIMTVISPDFPLLGKTVFEAISYSRKASKRNYAQKVLDKLQSFLAKEDQLKLDDRIGYGGNRLSKGQEMLLLLARAILTNKAIVLLDEPFKNMDRKMREHIIQILQDLGAKKMILLLSKRSRVKQLKFSSICSLDSIHQRVQVLKVAG